MRAIGRFLVLFVLLFTLVACGGSSSGKSKDTAAPVITLTGANPQVIEAGTAYVELGAAARDNRDGDLSNAIVIDSSLVDTSMPGSYVVSYAATDDAGNTGTATRTVLVEDTTPPVITLLGDEPQIIVAPNPYVELGATATDTLDGDLSAQVVIDATAVDTMVAGDHAVTYDVTDAAGNAAVTVTRIVRVELPPPPAAPTVSVEGDIKQLVFSWDEISNADYYRLMENADGHSGFTQVGDDIPMGTLAATRDVAVHLHDWVNALYTVQACNLGGCTGSAESGVTDFMLDTIAYFKASNTETFDRFGYPLALSSDGKTLAVGALSEDSSATGINGGQEDNSAMNAGAVYVFRSDGSSWYQQAYVKASNTDPGDRFGSDLALSADGDTLAVGAPYEDSSSTGINGDQFDDNHPCATSGAVYLFRFDDTEWTQQAYIKASNTGVGEYFGGVDYKGCIDGDLFGSSVALSDDGNVLVVGAPAEDSDAVGVNGDEGDAIIYSIEYENGAVYAFTFDGADWAQQAYIKPSFSRPIYYFGSRVTLSGDGTVLAVAAMLDDSDAVGVNDPPIEVNTGSGMTGAVHAFDFDGSTWAQRAYIKGSNTEVDDWFGGSIALSADGRTLAVGAVGEDGSAGGINGDETDNSASYSGAAYVYRFHSNTWSQQAYVKASNADTLHDIFFGRSVALSLDGDLLAVGASRENSSATGINGDQYSVSPDTENSGAVYLFRFEGSEWSQRAYIKSSDPFSSPHSCPAHAPDPEYCGWSLHKGCTQKRPRD